MSIITAEERVVKQPAEDRRFRMDFSKFAELEFDGQELTSVVSISVSPSTGSLVVGSGTVLDHDGDGKVESVVFRISGGLDEEVYLIEVLALTDGGNKLELDGILEIID